MGHIYTSDGKDFPSVTTVLSILGSKKLLKWANFMGFKHNDIDKILNDSATYGTMIHSVMESLLNSEMDNESCIFDINDFTSNPIIIDKIQHTIKSYRLLFPESSYKTINTELSLVNSKLGYGGTLDWLAEYNGELMLFDFKTSKSVKPYMLLQLSAYAKLLEVEKGVEVKAAAIIRLSESYCRYNKFTKEELDNGYKAFDYLLSFYNLYGEKIT